MKIISLIVCAIMLALPNRLVAQVDTETIERLTREALTSQLGTISVGARPVFIGGQLSGCSIEYNVLAQDWVYKGGAFIKINGSFGLMSASGKIAPILKVVLHDVDSRTMDLIPSPPESAYFVTNNFSTNQSSIIESYRSDTPGAIVVIFQLDPTFELLADGLQKDKVTIAFNRRPGGTDLQIPIDTSVEKTTREGERIQSPKASLEFVRCAKQLLENAL